MSRHFPVMFAYFLPTRPPRTLCHCGFRHTEFFYDDPLQLRLNLGFFAICGKRPFGFGSPTSELSAPCSYAYEASLRLARTTLFSRRCIDFFRGRSVAALISLRARAARFRWARSELFPGLPVLTTFGRLSISE